MATVNPACIHLSASSLGSFKACPQRFRLAYREGLRIAEDTEALRIGTNWHAIHEVYRNVVRDWAAGPQPPEFPDSNVAGTQAVIEHLNARYAQAPMSRTPEEWDLERQTLLTCFIGYLWHYQDDTIEYLSQEIGFELPLISPLTGMPLPTTDVLRVGRIDHLVRWHGMLGPVERKSTTRNIDLSGDYWERSQKDTQVSMYALAIADLFAGGDMDPGLLDGVGRMGNTLYDVWRRPQTKPKMLSQKDTTEFRETGSYCQQTFLVENLGEGTFAVNGVEATTEIGKSGNPAMRETVEMYAARLLLDITETPDKYFRRKEIPRTARDLEQFQRELYAEYQAMKFSSKSGCWYGNEQQCRATFACQYIPICYGSGADAVCDGKTTPPGFKRIYVDLTVDKSPIEEE